MHLDISFVFSNILGLFLMIGVGFFCAKRSIIPSSASPWFSRLLLNISMPCMCFITVAEKEFDPSFVHDAILINVIGLIMYTGLLVFNLIASYPLRVRKNHLGLWSFGATFPNNGFMGYPVILALLGEEALALAVMFSISFVCVAYVIGVFLVSRDGVGEDSKPDLIKIIFSPVNIATFLSVVFYMFQIPLPDALSIVITDLGDMTTPLSMIVIGMALADVSLRDLLTDRDAYTSALMKLVVTPLLMILIMRHMSFANPLIIPVVLITIAMPCAGVTTVFADMYHADTAFAAKVSFFSNVFCLATIPIMCMLI